MRLLWDTLSGNPADVRFYARWLRERWQALPPPGQAGNPAISPELEKQLQFLAVDLRRLGSMLCPTETPAIVSHAGNAPIQHIERRTKTADARDTFNADLLTDARRSRVEFHDLSKKESIHIYLRFSPVETGGADGGFVILKDLNFVTGEPEND